MVGATLAWALGTLLMLLPSPGSADGVMFVPAGAFWMGRDDGGADEAPAHRVYVRAFWIDRHKVTNAEFAEFLSMRGLTTVEGESTYDADDRDARIRREGERFVAHGGFERHPAVEVSWFGARDYCVWRGRRLPTEAEWEKAARGDDRRPYPWGAEAPTALRAIFARAYNATEPASGRPAGMSPYGIEDMAGNLREWTSTSYRPYPYREDDGRERAEPHATRVVRGASHDDPAEALRVTRRQYYEHRGVARGHHHVGFRCATSEDLGEIATPSATRRK